MFKSVRQIPVWRSLHALLTISFCNLTLLFLSGCPGGDVIGAGERQCLEERRCATDQEQVCGEDGKLYACASMARCEGAIVDPSGQACQLPPDPPVCEDALCDLFCEEGYERDANGCSLCKCKPSRECVMPGCIPGTVQECGPDRDGDGCPDCYCVEEIDECPDISCNLFCSNGYKTDESGCEICECVEGPICTYQPCPDGTISECSPDRDGDGCDECFCSDVRCNLNTLCEDYQGPWALSCEQGVARTCESCECVSRVCDGAPPSDISCPPGQQLQCASDGRGEEFWVCEPVECPPGLPPQCFANEREESADLNGDGCAESWCEPRDCPAIEPLDCGGGAVARGRGEDGCAILSCFPVSCPDIACFDLFCPYGYEIDEFGCQTCECRLPDCEEGAACNALCGTGSEMDQWACEFCGCGDTEISCLRDEDCAMNQDCVLDQLDPSLCCDLDSQQFCTDDLPSCVGTCEARTSCQMPGQACADGRLCQELVRDDCCPSTAGGCEPSLPVCPTLCL